MGLWFENGVQQNRLLSDAEKLVADLLPPSVTEGGAGLGPILVPHHYFNDERKHFARMVDAHGMTVQELAFILRTKNIPANGAPLNGSMENWELACKTVGEKLRNISTDLQLTNGEIIIIANALATHGSPVIKAEATEEKPEVSAIDPVETAEGMNAEPVAKNAHNVHRYGNAATGQVIKGIIIRDIQVLETDITDKQSGFVWTPEKQKLLKDLHEKGTNASLIAKRPELKGVVPSAVKRFIDGNSSKVTVPVNRNRYLASLATEQTAEAVATEEARHMPAIEETPAEEISTGIVEPVALIEAEVESTPVEDPQPAASKEAITPKISAAVEPAAKPEPEPTPEPKTDAHAATLDTIQDHMIETRPLDAKARVEALVNQPATTLPAPPLNPVIKIELPPARIVEVSEPRSAQALTRIHQTTQPAQPHYKHRLAKTTLSKFDPRVELTPEEIAAIVPAERQAAFRKHWVRRDINILTLVRTFGHTYEQLKAAAYWLDLRLDHEPGSRTAQRGKWIAETRPESADEAPALHPLPSVTDAEMARIDREKSEAIVTARAKIAALGDSVCQHLPIHPPVASMATTAAGRMRDEIIAQQFASLGDEIVVNEALGISAEYFWRGGALAEMTISKSGTPNLRVFAQLYDVTGRMPTSLKETTDHGWRHIATSQPAGLDKAELMVFKTKANSISAGLQEINKAIDRGVMRDPNERTDHPTSSLVMITGGMVVKPRLSTTGDLSFDGKGGAKQVPAPLLPKCLPKSTSYLRRASQW